VPDPLRWVTATRPGRATLRLAGVPVPAPLTRSGPAMPGSVVLAGSGRLGPALAAITAGAGERGDGRVGALVYDATGLSSPAALRDLYEFVHARIRDLAPGGRVLIIGDAVPGAAPAALEGFTRSLAKELRAGSTGQLLRVAPGGDDCLESPVRFFLSPRSAYISGQVIVVGPGRVPEPVDWNSSFRGKKAAVTGAARGIGAAIAEVLAAGGAEVICIDLPAQAGPLGELADRIGGTAVPLDITQTLTTIDSLSGHGPLDVFVHNAGITRDRTIAAMRPDEWDPVLGVNLSAVVEITDALTGDQALLNDDGAIVCVSSIAGIAGNRGQTNYGASKAGIIGLVRAGAPRGIRINAVAPGFIETEMTARMPFIVREVGRRMNSLGQAGQPGDVAEAVGWLAGPATAGVSGQVLRVCGQSLLGA
jgi:3-oxoacyl-[acyl-carrier protein] reductase